ncbi:MAG: IPT/TIG domain-containing protein [Pyrinomonadaceae bacterium]
MAFFIGGLCLLILYFFFYGIWSKHWNPADLFTGQDKRPSSSKFQFFLWTVVVIFSYVAVYAARALRGYYEPVDQIPVNLLIVMGFSITTAAAAKGITVGYVETGRVAKTEPDSTKADPDKPDPNKPGQKLSVEGKTLKSRAGWSSILVDDEGYPDLSKIQMIAWTFIAITVYLIGMVALVNALPHALDGVKDAAGNAVTWHDLTPAFLEKSPDVAHRISIPDISAALMVLMGLGQGAYLGKKLVTVSTARLTQLSPSASKPGSEVTISGVSLSEDADGNQVTLNGKPIEPPAEKVGTTATQIKFTFPRRQADGTGWKQGEVVSVGIISGGQSSANALPFTVTMPSLDRLSESKVAAGASLTLFGKAFGPTQGVSKVLIDGNPSLSAIPDSDWKETEIKITVPADLTKTQHQVGVLVDGEPQTNTLTFEVI